jgi:hypothetical protein
LIALFHRSLASASLRKDLAEGTEGQGDPSWCWGLYGPHMPKQAASYIVKFDFLF